jgi:hypothetical protein
MSKDAKKLHDLHTQLYKQFKALVPGFDAIIPEFDKEPVLLQKFADMVRILSPAFLIRMCSNVS